MAIYELLVPKIYKQGCSQTFQNEGAARERLNPPCPTIWQCPCIEVNVSDIAKFQITVLVWYSFGWSWFYCLASESFVVSFS